MSHLLGSLTWAPTDQFHSWQCYRLFWSLIAENRGSGGCLANLSPRQLYIAAWELLNMFRKRNKQTTGKVSLERPQNVPFWMFQKWPISSTPLPILECRHLENSSTSQFMLKMLTHSNCLWQLVQSENSWHNMPRVTLIKAFSVSFTWVKTILVMQQNPLFSLSFVDFSGKALGESYILKTDT